MSEACCAVLPERWRSPGAGGVTLRLYRVDDEGDERRYLQRARYWVRLSCSDTEAALAHPYREDVIENGELELYPPRSCGRLASLELVFWPSNLQRCSTARVGPVDVMAREFDGTVKVRLLCDSAMRSGKRVAASILLCHERVLAIARTGTHSFHAEGCGRSLELRCEGDAFGDDYRCEGITTTPTAR
jgi:hypothetical protein